MINSIRIEVPNMKKLLSVLALLLVCSLLLCGCAVSTMQLAGTAMEPPKELPEISYLRPVYADAADPAKGLSSMESVQLKEYVVLKGSTKAISLTGGWYAVEGTDVTYPAIRCTGDVHLVLTDGSKLTLTGKKYCAGIQVDENASIQVYAQSEGAAMGEIHATGGSSGAGIGGKKEGKMGAVTLNGGSILSAGKDGGAGIGGGEDGEGANITINGGAVTATGSGGAGIGGGLHASGHHIVINGGTVTATGGENAAGIGGGSAGDGEAITIRGGTVTAMGSLNGAGIGAGGYDRLSQKGGCAKDISLSGGTVSAVGGENGVGIGHSVNGESSAIRVAAAHTIRAGSTENPETAVCTNRTDDADLSADSSFLQRYVTVK